MEVKEKQNRVLHSRLPIDDDEKILACYKHHWFAYASLWIVGGLLIIFIIGMAALFAFFTGGSDTGSGSKTVVFSLAAVAVAVTVLFTLVPVYLRSQELVVLTDEAVLQILQPSLFASKISQLNLAHIADVSVRQDFLGTIFGYGKITVETPGEQDNYEFPMLPNPQVVTQEIIAAHENFQAAVEAGRIPTTLGVPQAPQIDAQQYQQFLQYQQMVTRQQKDASAQGWPNPQATESSAPQNNTDSKE